MAEKLDSGRFRNPFEQEFPDMVQALAAALMHLGTPRSEPRLGGEAIAPHQMAVPWGPGPIRMGVPKPKGPQHEAVLQDIKNAMSRLLRGNMPPKEADPRMVRQFERAPGHDAGFLPNELVRRRPLNAEVPGFRVQSEPDISYPGIQMKSEAWGPIEGEPGYQGFLRELEDLFRRGLLP